MIVETLRSSPLAAPLRTWLRALGPGLVSGAADDDPSGVATYSQAGAQFGFTLLWLTWFTTPLMIAVQLAAARIARVTGRGLTANFRAHAPRPVVIALALLLLAANTFNIMADLAAMGEALQLVVGGRQHGHALLFGLLLAAVQVRFNYARIADTLKWLCLALLAYVAVLAYVNVPWRAAAAAFVLPQMHWNADLALMVVAVLGTTISPYLLFWQAAHETEEMRRRRQPPLVLAPRHARLALLRIRVDTVAGMLLSNAIAAAIMIASAATLHANGPMQIGSAAQAAEALRPLAGDDAFLLFALGIIGAGLLAVPVLAGSAAYALSEAFGWRGGLNDRFAEAPRFYAILLVATLGGALLDFTPLDPIKALLYSAVVNGIAAVPVLILVMWLAGSRRVLGPFAMRGAGLAVGWLTAAVMACALAAWVALALG